MNEVRYRLARIREDERGYTLQEVLTAVAILGVLLAIAIFIFLALLERWRVEAAAEQIAADLRLAHTNATNQLIDWRVVLVPRETDEASDEGSGVDYHLIKLKAPYPGAPPEVGKAVARTFPANVRVRDHDEDLDDKPDTDDGWVAPSDPAPAPTRTLEFNPNGTMSFKEGPNGSVCVTVDGDPELRVTVLSSVSRVKIKDETCGAVDSDPSEG